MGGSDQEFLTTADGEIIRLLRGSQRVNAVLVLWDQWLEGDLGGAVCLTHFRVHENLAPRVEVPDLPRLLRSAAVDGSLESETLTIPRGDWTVACTVRRHGGPGPLFESFDGQLQVVIDRAGRLANRIGGEMRVTDLPMDSINGRWVTILLRSRGGMVELRIDGEVTDEWTAPDAEYSGLRMMTAVDGDLRETLVYSNGLTDGEADQLASYLAEGDTTKYVQFRQGDVARFRASDPPAS